MMEPIYTYFSENLAAISKEELLRALESALKSADYWREACLLGLSTVQERALIGGTGLVVAFPAIGSKLRENHL